MTPNFDGDADLRAAVDQVLDEAAVTEAEFLALPVLADVGRLLERTEQIAALRAAKGRSIGEEHRRTLHQIHDRLAELAATLEGER